MIAVHPYCFDIGYIGTYFYNFLGNFLINANIGGPIVSNKSSIIFEVDKIVHFWFDKTFIENQKILDFLQSNKDRETLFLFKYFSCLFFFFVSKLILCRQDSNPVKVKGSLAA